MARVPAIDVLFSPEALSCFTAAAPVFSCLEHPHALVAGMDASGVQKALLAPCKRWECERHWLCGEVQVDEIASYIQAAPGRLAGLAGYNPYSIVESLTQIHSAVRLQDMRGVYVHTEGADLLLCDRRMYPLYARCTELAVPVMLQVGIVGQKGLADPSELVRIAVDFPELEIVAAWTGPLDIALIRSLVARFPHMYFAFPAKDSAQSHDVAELLNLETSKRCMWGSNGLPWQELLDNIYSLGLPDEVLQSFLNGTAARIFQLNRTSLPQLPSEEPLPLAE